MSQILPESYTFDRDKLLEPIRKASTLRGLGIPINTNAEPKDNTTVIYTVTDDPKIGIAPEPIAGVRSTNTLTSAIKMIPVISAPVSYKYYELQRINDGKLPFDARMEILSKWIADREEAYAFAVSSTGVRDSDGIPFLQGGSDVSSGGLNTPFSLVSGDAALTALALNIGKLIERYGTLKNRPLILAFNAVAYARAIGLTSSKTDETFMKMAQEMLTLHGGAGSGIVLINHLGCAITVDDDVMVITDSTDETMALMLVDSNHFEITTSRLDSLSDGISQVKGLEVNIVERFMPYVHDALSIRYELNVAIA